MKVPEGRIKPVEAEPTPEPPDSDKRPARAPVDSGATVYRRTAPGDLQSLAHKRASTRRKSADQHETSTESEGTRGSGDALTASDSGEPLGALRRARRDRNGRDGDGGEGERRDGRHQQTAKVKAERTPIEATVGSASRRRPRDELSLPAIDGHSPLEAKPQPTPAEAASHLTELLLLASRHAQQLDSNGLSPLQIQLLAVRQYLGLSDPGDPPCMLSDVKAMLLERQSGTASLAPSKKLPASTVEQDRNALLPLMLLNALQRRSRPKPEQARDKIDLIIDLRDRARG